MNQISNANSLKDQVKSHWENEVCGTRFTDAEIHDRQFFKEIEDSRYQAEGYICDFAKFDQSKGKKILEIGVGAGTDFIQWLRHGAIPTGIDMTTAAIQTTNKRLENEGYHPNQYKLMQGDAENLDFEANQFDIVYSHGVLHHTPDTDKALSEVFRVLKIGGEARIMVYGVPCWSGLMLWVRYALLKGKPFRTQKDVIFENLESPGTKAYQNSEFSKKMEAIGFKNVEVHRVLSSGDLLLMPPSQKYQSRIYKVIWRLWPRFIIKNFGKAWGTALICVAKKSV